jgi:multidrug/hemolysin transport system permease protein
MLALVKRNIKIYFRNKGAWLASLLTVFIIIGLYALFLGDQLSKGFEGIGLDSPRLLTDGWIMAGIISIMPLVIKASTLSISLGAVSIVSDRSKGLFKDFYCSPVSRSRITLGYILSLALISFFITLIGFILGEIYIVVNGGELLSFLNMLKVVGIIAIDDLATTSIVMFIAMFITTEGAYTAVCTVIGTISGFITGIYIPVGSLPDSVATAVKCFPISHAGSMLRQIFTESAITECTKSVPAELKPDVIDQINSEMGIIYSFGDHTVTDFESIIVLIATAAVFFVLTAFAARRKKK